MPILREGANVHVTLLGPESRARNLGTIKPNVFSQPQSLLRKTLSCAYLSYQRAHSFDRCGFARRRGIQGIQGIAPNKFLEEPAHDFRVIEDFQAKNSATDAEPYSTLTLVPREGASEFLYRIRVALKDGGHGAGWRQRLEPRRFGSNVSPDRRLIRFTRAI